MAQPFEPLDPDSQLGYLLARAAARASRLWHTALRAHGINPRLSSALAVLAREPGLSQAELARRVLVTPQTMSESLNGLLRTGLITRTGVAPGLAASIALT